MQKPSKDEKNILKKQRKKQRIEQKIKHLAKPSHLKTVLEEFQAEMESKYFNGQDDAKEEE